MWRLMSFCWLMSCIAWTVAVCFASSAAEFRETLMLAIVSYIAALVTGKQQRDAK